MKLLCKMRADVNMPNAPTESPAPAPAHVASIVTAAKPGVLAKPHPQLHLSGHWKSIAKGAANQAAGYTPLVFSAVKGDLPIVRALLDGKADPNVACYPKGRGTAAKPRIGCVRIWRRNQLGVMFECSVHRHC